MIFFLRSAALALAVIVLAGSAGAAELEHEDVKGRWGIGANLSNAYPIDDEGDSGFYPELRMHYGVMDQVAVGLEVGVVEFDYTIDATQFGTLEGIPIMTVLQWRHPFILKNTEATFVLTGGIGALLWRFDESTVIRQKGEQIKADTAFGVKGAAGIDFVINEKWTLNIEAGYVSSTTTLDFNVPGIRAQENVDTDFVFVGGGFRIRV